MQPLSRTLSLALLFAFVATATVHAPAHGQSPSEPAGANAGTPEEQMHAAMQAAKKVAVDGPADIPLLDQANLSLPAGFVFIPAKEAGAILQAMGNRPGSDLLGMIFPLGTNDDWFIAMQYEKSGYIKDDDAKDWNADELLTSMKEGTEETNAERKKRGIPEIVVTGWVERPQYDATTHQLKWSLGSKGKGQPDDAPQGVNYNTYALGREGYISMNLVTDVKSVDAEKPIASQLLSGLKFKDGKGYTDFNSTTDKVAAYGLAALIGGVALKKLGLLALAGVFLAKFAKVIFLAVVAAGGALKFWRKRTAAPAAASATASTAVPSVAMDVPPDQQSTDLRASQPQPPPVDPPKA